MKVCFKITTVLLTAIRSDLRRPHPFAHERVGFISAGLTAVGDGLLGGCPRIDYYQKVLFFKLLIYKGLSFQKL